MTEVAPLRGALAAELTFHQCADGDLIQQVEIAPLA